MGGWNGRPAGNASSIKELVVEVEGDQPVGRVMLQKAFDSIDLKKLSDSPAKYKEIDFNQGRTGSRAPIEVGKIYVVTLNTMNHQRGQPGELTFKVWVDRDSGAASDRPARGGDNPFGGF